MSGEARQRALQSYLEVLGLLFQHVLFDWHPLRFPASHPRDSSSIRTTSVTLQDHQGSHVAQDHEGNAQEEAKDDPPQWQGQVQPPGLQVRSERSSSPSPRPDPSFLSCSSSLFLTSSFRLWSYSPPPPYLLPRPSVSRPSAGSPFSDHALPRLRGNTTSTGRSVQTVPGTDSGRAARGGGRRMKS